MASIDEYTELLSYLRANEAKLKIFLSADEKIRGYRMRLKGKKSSRTIFMSEQLQFIMNEYCIENDMKIGDFAEIAIIDYLNRMGMDKKLQKIIIFSSSHESEGEQGETEKKQIKTEKTTGRK